MKLKNLYGPVVAIVFLGFCFLYTLGCGGSSGGTTSNPVGAGPGSLTLTGKVVAAGIIQNQIVAATRLNLISDQNASNFLPISNADVWLESNPLIYDRTNASGVYHLVGVPEGEHRIVARAYNNSRSAIFKMRVNATNGRESSDNTQPDILLKEAKNYVTGVLRDSNGKPIPAGTNLTLWGESFSVGNDGKFTSPSLPEDFTEENLIMQSNAISGELIIKAAFISDTAPPEIEVFVPEKGKSGNSAPIVFLTARKGGVPASKVSPNEQLILSAEALDSDAGDANSLTVYWSSNKGSLATNSAQPFRALWTAPDHPGMATIEIRVYDSHGAYGSVKLKILVGLDKPPTGPEDTLSPTVESVFPAHGAVNVAVDTQTTVIFNEPVATLTVNANTFFIKSGESVIAGNVVLNSDGKSATFKPAANLPAGSVIAITLKGIKDLAGNMLIADVYTYTTAIEPDTTAPGVVGMVPVENAINIDLDTKITVTFSEAMGTSTINGTTFAVASGGISIAGSIAFSEDGKAATFSPAASLPYGSLITVTISTGVKDLAGNALSANKAWNFATLPTPDTIAPTNQDTVLAESVKVKGGAAVAIVSSGDTNNTVWLAPAGTTVFAESATMTKAGGTATTINAPTDEGLYKLFIIDAAGNVSAASIATVTVDNTAPTNQDTVLAASVTVKGGVAVTIVSSGDTNNTVWLAPAGTTVFAESATMTKAGGTATSINAPTDEGLYKLFIIDAAGNVSAASIAIVTVDNTAPTNQDTVLAASVTVKGGAAITIVSSGDAHNTVWLAQAGTTVFAESAIMTKAGGTATTINAPTDEGLYKLFIIDAAGNVSAASIATVTVDNTAPTNQDTVLAASVTVKGGVAVTIVSSGDTNNTVWLAPAGTTVFAESATMTKAGGTATSINAPTDEGLYKLFIIDAAGNVSAASIATVTVDNTAPTNQDTVLAASVTVKGGAAITIVSSGDAHNTVWLAQAGTTVFAESAIMTKAGGTATTINAPTDEGLYKLFIIDAAGNVSAASIATVTVDNTAPTNQDTVLAASVTVKGGVAVTIVSSGDTNNTVWLAPAGTTVFAESATMTNAGGTATSINAPTDEGLYRLFIIDAAGNVSAASTATVMADNTCPVVSAPTNVAQLLRSGQISTSTIQSNEAGKIYFIKNGEVAATQTDIDTAITGNLAFLAKDNALANIPYTVTVSSVAEGLYDLIAVDAAGNLSVIESSWLTVIVDYISPTIGNLIYVPTGTFQRDSTPANTSTVTTFKMSQNLITRLQFFAIMGNDPSETTIGSLGGNTPVQRVNWYHAIAFCNKLSLAEGLSQAYTVTGIDFSTLTFGAIPIIDNTTWNAVSCNWGANGYRLPTEMEWKWAAMGATSGSGYAPPTYLTGYGKHFAGSNSILANGSGGSNIADDYAWYFYNEGSRTRPVGGRAANELGLHDMSGNVYEWCWDWSVAFPSGSLIDYRGGVGINRIILGGCYASTALGLSNRGFESPSWQSDSNGFRVVRP